ncbi:hypothetical protein EV702DRAFT_1223961 [Suillus placidus]|uniref:Uncharacterized protein n=1 Tax=Suillus placidus TaxID=48579 RepID=A0A9P7A7N0_9AGAM|nr:hypothetical protein EV702DRAFT_1223961 [Suillus placidus]
MGFLRHLPLEKLIEITGNPDSKVQFATFGYLASKFDELYNTEYEPSKYDDMLFIPAIQDGRECVGTYEEVRSFTISSEFMELKWETRIKVCSDASWALMGFQKVHPSVNRKVVFRTSPPKDVNVAMKWFAFLATKQVLSPGDLQQIAEIPIVSIVEPMCANPYNRRDITDQTPQSNPLLSRVWSRATTTGLSRTLVLPAVKIQEHSQALKFRSTGLHPELLRNPSAVTCLYFYLLPLMTFYHIPVQTFFDFNAVFIILQTARFPNPSTPGVPGSGKNWALGAAVYIACWLAWITMVFVLYELVYSFWRRWCVTAFNLASMTSYTNFCFMQYVRFSAFFGENGSLRDGIAETFWFYSQNLLTVTLLLPRVGLSLALLLAYTSSSPDYIAILEAGINHCDETYFSASDGTLTAYPRSILIANAAWTAWRVLVLFLSWIGLWILSGQGCAGLCGPHYRWEDKRSVSNYNTDGASEVDALPWSWRTCTRLRIQEVYDFCLTGKPPAWWSGTAKKDEPGPLGLETSPPFEVEQVLAAVGIHQHNF